MHTAMLTKIVLSLIIGVGLSSMAQAKIIWQWQGSLDNDQRQAAQAWLIEVEDAVNTHLGPLPLDIYVTVHRRVLSLEPVPWAQTDRSSREGLHFFIDPRFSSQRFLADWTAPHEFSHLYLPYLGSRYSWFAEGFASYMQYWIMEEMGEISAAERRQRWFRHFNKAYKRYTYVRQPFAVATQQLKRQRDYPTMYWGGAAYFYRVDRALRSQGKSLRATIRQYQKCCRLREERFEPLIRSLDRISNSSIFSAELKRVRVEPGFPLSQAEIQQLNR